MKLKFDSILMSRRHPPKVRKLTETIAIETMKRWLVRSMLTSSICCFTSINPALAQSRTGFEAEVDSRVYWPRKDFVIPFNVDSTGQAPSEIQLEFSDDGGRNWSLYSKSDVRTKQFQFQAEQDGEYLFRLKTFDNRGRSFENPGEPLSVVVDTTKPTAELIIDMDARGQMLAEFRIKDNAIDASSIVLSYHTESNTQSREILFELTRGRTNDEWIGSGSWDIPDGTTRLSVRLTAKDKAGNTVEVTRLPQLPRSASLSNGLQLASGKTREVNPSRGSNAKPAIGTGVVNARDPGLNGSQSTGAFGGTLQRQPDEVSSSRFNASNAEQQHSTSLSSRQSKLPIRTMTDEEYEQVTASKLVNVASQRGNQSLLSTASGEGSASNGKLNVEMEQRSTRLHSQTTFHRDIKPLYSSSKAFSLDYDIENDPDAPISSVELWGTTDEGQTWQMWGQDPDRASPFDIQVEEEGLFGFRMIIVGNNGLASNRPRNGDNADAWIHVDTRQPQVKLTSALYGKGTEAGALVIEYKASDAYFSERPITLSYSETPDGPWNNIASGVKNSGRYVWPADPSLPPTIYLRIEAHDAAGNLAVHCLEHPIEVQGLAPRGRIQGFRPIK